MATDTAASGSVFEVGARSILTGLGTPLVMLLLLVSVAIATYLIFVVLA